MNPSDNFVSGTGRVWPWFGVFTQRLPVEAEEGGAPTPPGANSKALGDLTHMT